MQVTAADHMTSAVSWVAAYLTERCVAIVLRVNPSGVLQIEAMAQLAGIVMLDPKDQEAKNQFFFGGIEGCR